MHSSSSVDFTLDSSTPCDGRFLVGAFDVIEDVDAAACTLLGYARAEIIGLHGSELVPLEEHSKTAASLDRMRRGEVFTRDGQLRRKDGAILGVAVTARPLPDGRLLLCVRRSAQRPIAARS